MSISRRDLDQGLVDLSDTAEVGSALLGPVHPGEILKSEFIAPLGLSVYRLAQELGVPRTRLNDVVLGRRSISAETALRLARYFRTSPGFWLNLQSRFDLEVARRDLGAAIDSQVKPRAA